MAPNIIIARSSICEFKSEQHFQMNRRSEVRMPFKPGHEEDEFLQKLELKLWEAEFLADNCSRVSDQ